MRKNDDDPFLARWLDGKLTEEERNQFEFSEACKEYKEILAAMDRFSVPDFDKEKLYKNINNKTAKISKRKKFLPYWGYAAAASIAILFGIFYYLNPSVTHSTNFGEQLSLLLPDGSEVILNAKSTLSYDEKKWEQNRKVHLEGEAYFKVKKGSSFYVISKDKEVKVLGTEFSVNALNNIYEVFCFEGKVQVKNLDDSVFLTKGLAYRDFNKEIEKFNFTETNPTWIRGESTFKGAPLYLVILAIEKQYNVNINFNRVDTNKRFTGSFSHKNLDIALRTVFSSMEIQYQFKNNTSIILTKD
ncbi:FecR family protein [Polaribacter porphyrae]|uniref:Anti-sigma factor n=1 Tax=Polaribacter porphyrae TaxID=1137780 RepID=A0A2S7WMZ3_9FLAO|nr:FecR family protein [Polaribacter porphyrae]PQJ78987.1 hypothetical protein BTO18_07270 [Polaribacter porphyrae]